LLDYLFFVFADLGEIGLVFVGKGVDSAVEFLANLLGFE
jgi:hypothetical protein